MGIERMRELRRRRHRTKKMKILDRKLKTANHSEVAVIVDKLRNLTPGADEIIANRKLEV